MSEPPARFLSRSGIRSSLRRILGVSDLSSVALAAEVAREVGRATKTLRVELDDAKEEHRKFRQEMRERQHGLRQEVRLLHAVLAANSLGHHQRYAGALQPAEVISHARAAINAAAIDVVPTPHMVVSHLLPPLTYDALLDATPPDECFSDRDPVKQNFRLVDGKVVPDFTATMWRFMEGQVIAEALVPALMARFRPYIDAVYAERYGERGTAISALPHYATAGRLMLRRPGYHLDPHIDPRRVIVTCLIYLARHGDSAAFGTQLFTLNATPNITSTKTYYPGEAGYISTLAKTVAFSPNTAVAFLNAGAAAHGATIPDTAPKDTKRYAYQFYMSPDPAGLAAITGETADENPD